MKQNQPGAVDLTNSYRPDGLRHRRTDGSGTAQMLWDGDDLLAQVDLSGNLIEYWYWGAELPDGFWSRLVKARIPGSANPNQYLHSDWQGTVLAASGSTGAALTQNYPPRPWGADGPGVTPLSWLGNHGYWYEGSLARPMHYVRARWYPDVGAANGGQTG